MGWSVSGATKNSRDDFIDGFNMTQFETKEGKLITRGNGKGINKQSELSSIFEAKEHTFYESYFMWRQLYDIKKTL